MEQFWLINGGMRQLETGRFATINEIIDLGKHQQWMLEALGKKLTENWSFAQCQGTDPQVHLQREICNCIMARSVCCHLTQESN